jgi:hypothetical protein
MFNKYRLPEINGFEIYRQDSLRLMDGIKTDSCKCGNKRFGFNIRKEVYSQNEWLLTGVAPWTLPFSNCGALPTEAYSESV